MTWLPYGGVARTRRSATAIQYWGREATAIDRGVQRLSNTAAMPWPPPMHIASSP